MPDSRGPLPAANRMGALTTLALVLCATTLTAAAPEPVTPRIELAGIRFDLRDPSGTWLLTIGGPNDYYQRREFSNEDPVVSLAGDDRPAPQDGSYVWELRRAGVADGVQSGAFNIVAGQVQLAASPTSTPSEAPAKPTPLVGGGTHFPNDVTIAGRMCVGDECLDGESLPFEAIRMKQNNAWINVVDTSDSATFPSNDWQIKFNDSTTFGNGGTNYFGIEDRGTTGSSSTVPLRVDAGAGADSIRVDQNGRVGLGTATPATQLHVVGDTTLDGDFNVLSSRDAKTNLTPVDSREILARLSDLPVLEWSYRDDRAVRHLGPTAEDFRATFPLGKSNRSVNPLDLAGVALAAVQGLSAELAEERSRTQMLLGGRDAELEGLKADRDELLRRLQELEAAFDSLVAGR